MIVSRPCSITAVLHSLQGLCLSQLGRLQRQVMLDGPQAARRDVRHDSCLPALIDALTFPALDRQGPAKSSICRQQSMLFPV